MSEREIFSNFNFGGSILNVYMAKLDEICYQVCFSSWRDVYETIQNPKFQNPAIGGIWENCIFLFLPCPPFSTVIHASLIPLEGPPNDLKILPMGILHDYMLCWTSLGPFRYPRGPQNGPKQHQKGLEWLKITRMAQNVTAWLQMTLNTSNGYIKWLNVMLDHPGPFSEAHGGPIIARNSTKNGPSWPKMALHDRKWP